jgi:hypothetical protein
MPQTYTRWSYTAPDSLQGDIHIKAGDTFNAPDFIFRFPNGDYLDQTSTEANATGNYILSGDYVFYVINHPYLTAEFPDENNTEYFNSAGNNIAYRQTDFVDAVYHYTITQPDGTETQYLILMPTIETAIAELAQQVIDTQCNCKINNAVAENFIKAKAMQQLVYSKIGSYGSTYNAEFMAEVNADIATLTDFLAGTNNVCGC